MKILTKKWAENYKLALFINRLKEFNEQEQVFSAVETKAKKDFYKEISLDAMSSRVVLNATEKGELYKAYVDRNKKTLLSMPKKIYGKLKNVKVLVLGYALQQDKELLESFSKKLVSELEKLAKRTNDLTEIAENYLKEELVLDDIVGELVYSEYSSGNNYFLNVGGYTLCIEDYKIIEREDFIINEWEQENPLSLWTALYSAELRYNADKRFELHLLLVDGDRYANEKFWYFTLSGTNVKILNS